jgi:hypothetical protein
MGIAIADSVKINGRQNHRSTREWMIGTWTYQYDEKIWISYPKTKHCGIHLFLNTYLPGEIAMQMRFRVNFSWWLSPF